MKISRRDARMWMEFFASVPEGEQMGPRQQELYLSILRQMEAAVEARRQPMMDAIPGLKQLRDRTTWIGPEERFPGGCRSCLLGTGLSAIRKTNVCNAACPFCYDYGHLKDQPPIGEGLFEIGGTRFSEADLPLLLSMSNCPTGVSYVYLEPFMEIEKYYGIIRAFHEAGIHQHMYTNGLNATRENLRALADAGLDELRFNLGASNCADRVIEAMGVASEIFPQVGIETPMTPEFYETFMKKKETILATGLDFINCAELHLNENNLCNYLGEPLYLYRLGYLSPVFSRDLTLRLMRQAAEENWGIVVHDCSNATKFARDLHLKTQEGGWFGASAWVQDFDVWPPEIFLPFLEDDTLPFPEEEPLPVGFRPGDIVL